MVYGGDFLNLYAKKNFLFLRGEFKLNKINVRTLHFLEQNSYVKNNY